jgi:hypothetical protein
MHVVQKDVIMLFKFTYVNKSNPTASVFHLDLVCSPKIILTVSKHAGASRSFRVLEFYLL